MSEQESDILARLRAANPALVDEDRGRGAVAQAALQRILEDPAALAAPEPDERAARRPRSRPRQIWRRPRGAARATVAAVPVLVTIIVTVVVAAIALTSLRHHHSSVRHHHSSTAVAPTVPRIAAKNGEIALDLSGQLASGHVPAVEDRLELVNPDGSGRRYVAAYPCPRSAGLCDVWAFAWSPGGTQLAYLAGVNSVGPPNEYTLYLVGANGQSRPLTACGSCSDVSWSPNGSQIAVERDNGPAGPNVWVVNATTGAMRPVTNCPSLKVCGEDPQWSPSGRSILFIRASNELGPESDVWSLDTIDPDGSQLTKITTIPGVADPHLQWSPDGREIEFEYNNGIYTVNADGTHLRRLVAQGGNPAWSPDGTELVYSTWPAGETGAHTQLWTINANGSDNQLLYASGSDNRLLARSGNFNAQMWSPLIWSPDGKQIAFSAQHGTYQINTNGTGLHRIGPSTGELAWQPIPSTR